ncbi:MAG: D-alanine--D-alanine ligase [Planctomycetes bacterium]|nr:D-alanine--D-alanine ligase [Planctomycetota bacterium]
MRIALTYDLREDYRALGFAEHEVAEFDRRDTIDSLEDAIRAAGHEVVRVGHAQALAAALLAGERWDLVFNICESLYGFGRESLVPALCEHFRIPTVFSDPLVCALTLHKVMAKRVLRDQGVPTTDFREVTCLADLARVDLPFPLFCKPVAEGSSKGVALTSKVRNATELERTCSDLLARYRQPVLVEPFLAGREFTVGILGTGEKARSLGALEVVLKASAEAEIYTYANKEDCEIHVRYLVARDELAERACAIAVQAWRALGCRDGGRVDLRADGAGRLQVLEANPLPGLHPEHSDLPILCSQIGLPYRRLIAEILESAIARIEATRSLSCEVAGACGS